MGDIIAFYDGSIGHRDGRRHSVTLAGYAARREVWDEFEPLWRGVLADSSNRPPCEALHMRTAMTLNKEFSARNGWTKSRVQSLLMDLSNKCLSPLGWRESVEDGLVGASCTVTLDDYARAQQDCPYLRGMEPEEVCVNCLAEVALKMLPEDPAGTCGKRGSLHMYFDRNEKFMHKLNAPWLQRRLRGGPLLLIEKIEAADSAMHPGLQAADYLAWLTNRDRILRDAGETYLALRMMMIAAALVGTEHYDYEKLMKRYREWPVRVATGNTRT